MKILKLVSSNVKRLKAVEIVPKDNVVIISGKNAQGKTSVLDSIELALKASNFNKPGRQIHRPIRDGQDKAIVILETEDYIITKNWTANDKSYLKVENKKGASFKSPQALIDSFLGDLSFDPLEFARLRGADQKETLIRFIDTDIDIRELEQQKTKLYDDRTLKGRELKTSQARTENIPNDPDVPEKEVSVSDLTAELTKANEANFQRRNISLKHAQVEQALTELDFNITEAELNLEKLKAQLPVSKQQLSTLKQHLKDSPEINIDEITNRLEDAQALNIRIRDHAEAKRYFKLAADLQFQYDTLSKQIEKLDLAKSNALSTAKMPIKGLGIDDDGITFNDKPFSQIGSANQLKVSLAIAMSMNPTLKVIRISDGSLLDPDNLEIIKQMAKDNDYQVWVECVQSGGKVGFTLEDGEVVAIDGNTIIKESVVEE